MLFRREPTHCQDHSGLMSKCSDIPAMKADIELKMSSVVFWKIIGIFITVYIVLTGWIYGIITGIGADLAAIDKAVSKIEVRVDAIDERNRADDRRQFFESRIGGRQPGDSGTYGVNPTR